MVESDNITPQMRGEEAQVIVVLKRATLKAKEARVKMRKAKKKLKSFGGKPTAQQVLRYELKERALKKEAKDRVIKALNATQAARYKPQDDAASDSTSNSSKNATSGNSTHNATQELELKRQSLNNTLQSLKAKLRETSTEVNMAAQQLQNTRVNLTITNATAIRLHQLYLADRPRIAELQQKRNAAQGALLSKMAVAKPWEDLSDPDACLANMVQQGVDKLAAYHIVMKMARREPSKKKAKHLAILRAAAHEAMVKARTAFSDTYQHAVGPRSDEEAALARMNLVTLQPRLTTMQLQLAKHRLSSLKAQEQTLSRGVAFADSAAQAALQAVNSSNAMVRDMLTAPNGTALGIPGKGRLLREARKKLQHATNISHSSLAHLRDAESMLAAVKRQKDAAQRYTTALRKEAAQKGSAAQGEKKRIERDTKARKNASPELPTSNVSSVEELKVENAPARVRVAIPPLMRAKIKQLAFKKAQLELITATRLEALPEFEAAKQIIDDDVVSADPC